VTVWFDVEDLIRYFQNAARPTGIQRLCFEVYRAIWAQAGASGEVRFCRRGAGRDSLRAIHFPALEAGVLAMVGARGGPSALPLAKKPHAPAGLAALARRLPLQYRLPLGVLARAASAALPAIADLAVAPWRGAQAVAGNRFGGHQFDLDGPDIGFGPGDWLVNFGAPWGAALYSPEFLTAFRAKGARFALLVHDLIPRLYPEWCGEGVVSVFHAWLRDVLPRADLIFTNSRSVAGDTSCYLASTGRVFSPPVVLPVGAAKPAPDTAPAILAQPYVLLVGTIEVRKNHAAMLRVWRRLLATMPEQDVPELVFAGKVGWLTVDLMQQLENCAWANGKIRFIDNPDEAVLANLYRHCLFTVFPSLCEGWGLPVTESLSFGKTVAASRYAAVPEAGGTFCAYYDPENVQEMFEVISGLIENPSQVAALEAHIAAAFRPPSWAETAAVVLARLGLEEHALGNEDVSLPSIG